LICCGREQFLVRFVCNALAQLDSFDSDLHHKFLHLRALALLTVKMRFGERKRNHEVLQAILFGLESVRPVVATNQCTVALAKMVTTEESRVIKLLSAIYSTSIVTSGPIHDFYSQGSQTL
jgi:hypothetical protein